MGVNRKCKTHQARDFPVRQQATRLKWSEAPISMAYFTTIVTLLFDENDIFISLESSIHALQDGCSISVGYKI